MAESAFAQHIINSIRNELDLLKQHNYLQPQAYNDILNLLPKNVTSNRNMPIQSSPASFAGAMPSPANDSSTLPPPPSYNSSNDSLGSAEALYDYHGENPATDLTLRRGDIIQITEYVNNDWWRGSLNGKTGIFPSNYVKKIEKSMNEKKTSPPPTPDRHGYPNQNRNSYGDYPPPAAQTYTPPVAQTYTPPPAQTYTPPPAQTYAPPPPVQSNSYAPPPIQSQVQSYAPPPVQQVATSSSAPAVVEEESKVASFGKKFAGNVANAATWGFGATLGSDLANSIF